MGRSTEGYGSSFLSECSPPNAWICGCFMGGRCTRNRGMPHTGVPKVEKVKMRNLLNAVRGLLWIGGRRLQPPAFILQPNRRRMPADWAPYPSWHTPPAKPPVLLRFHFGGYRPASPPKAPHEATRGAYGRGFGLCGTFPSNRVKQLSV